MGAGQEICCSGGLASIPVSKMPKSNHTEPAEVLLKVTVLNAFYSTRIVAKDLLAVGETLHVICGSNGKPKLLPEKYRVILGTAPVSNPLGSRS